MRFLFSNHYWTVSEESYLGKSDYEQYGAVIRRYKNKKGKWDKAWFIDFLYARDIAHWLDKHKKIANGGMFSDDLSKDEGYFVFNPFHECE